MWDFKRLQLLALWEKKMMQHLIEDLLQIYLVFGKPKKPLKKSLGSIDLPDRILWVWLVVLQKVRIKFDIFKRVEVSSSRKIQFALLFVFVFSLYQQYENSPKSSSNLFVLFSLSLQAFRSVKVYLLTHDKNELTICRESFVRKYFRPNYKQKTTANIV